MNIAVHYHALLREKTGLAREEVDVPVPTTAASVLAAIGSRHASLAALMPALKIAVNDEFAEPGRAIEAADHVDVFPPFGGG